MARVAVDLICLVICAIITLEHFSRGWTLGAPLIEGLLHLVLYACAFIVFRSVCFALFDIADAHVDRLEMKTAGRERQTARMARRTKQRLEKEADERGQRERPETEAEKAEDDRHQHNEAELESGVPDVPTEKIGPKIDPEVDWDKYKI